MNFFPQSQELSEHDIQKLNSFSEEDCVKAMQILKARLKFLRSKEFKFLQPVSGLNLSSRAKNVLLSQRLYTVQDVLIFGLDRIAVLRNAGAHTVKEIKEAVEKANKAK